MTKKLEDLEKFIKIAEEMLGRGDFDTCINRLYISSENTASIILEKVSGNNPKRHDKMTNSIEHLFKTGNIERDFSNTMRRLYELHLLSDYGNKNIKEANKEELRNIIKEIKDFINIARNL